jgi:hypothetical protein
MDHRLKSQAKRRQIMKLQEKLDAYKKDFVAQVPEAALAVMHRAAEDLQHSGILEQTVQVGDIAPDFRLKDIHGDEVALVDLLAKGPVVLGFYRGRW